jgi:tyrosyl-tRNA synthetase
VIAYLKCFTFLDRLAIDALAAATAESPERREAQRVLAREVSTVVHGADQVARVERASSVVFSEDIASLPLEDLMAVVADVPSTEISRADFGVEGIGIVDLIARVRLAPSKSEARRLVQSGGVYLNNRRAADLQAKISTGDAIGGQVLLLRKGAKDQHLVRLT